MALSSSQSRLNVNFQSKVRYSISCALLPDKDLLQLTHTCENSGVAHRSEDHSVQDQYRISCPLSSDNDLLQITQAWERQHSIDSSSLPLAQGWHDGISQPTQPQESSEVYVLELEQKKWYVGSTHDPEFRFESHISGKGSKWTQKYPFVRIHKRIPDQTSFDEDKHTKIYMAKYGIENVRGGSYCDLKIPQCLLIALKKELKTANNECFRCGKPGHIATECGQGPPGDGDFASDGASIRQNYSEWQPPPQLLNPVADSQQGQGRAHEAPVPRVRTCYNCGKVGHISINCRSFYTVDGRPLVICPICSEPGHTRNCCSARLQHNSF
jgi:hypothetical protein